MLYFENCATVQDVINLKQAECPDHGEILSIPTSSTLLEAISYMADHHVGAIFLKNESGEISGILSERDIIMHIARAGLKAFDFSVEELSRKQIHSCHDQDKLKKVAAQMADLNIRHIAVKNEKDTLIGVISASDVDLFAGKG